LVNGLGLTSWPGRYDARLAFHRSCHSRGTATGAASVSGCWNRSRRDRPAVRRGRTAPRVRRHVLASFPTISSAMGSLKLEHIRAVQPDALARST
jgi:L-lactate dehydrogenase complex protein LldE